jgi:hypothetical protein
MALLSEIAAGDFEVGAGKKIGGGTMSPVIYRGQTRPDIQLDAEVACLFAPSGFDGSDRLSVTFSVDEATASALEALEAAIGRAHGSTLRSAVKRKEGYGPSFRVKYDATRCLFMDSSNNALSAPSEWRDQRMKIIVSPRCVYKQVMDGVVWDLVAVQILGPTPHKQVTFK